MNMNSSNNGYPPPTSYPHPHPYSSTPSNMGPQRPRFGFTGPAPYPRPRSSASKPNPDSFSGGIINQSGNSFYSENSDEYDVSYHNNSSVYYSANDTFHSDDSLGSSPMVNRRNDFKNNSMWHGQQPVPDNTTAPFLQKPPLLTSKYAESNAPVGNNRNGRFQNFSQAPSSNFSRNKKQSFSARKFVKAKKGMMESKGSLKCDLCNLDFTSQIPYDMHLKGARHAKKVKSQQIFLSIQAQGIATSGDEKTYFCSLCNVQSNSPLQFQTHLDGSKHKNKLNPKEQPDQKEQSQDQTENEVKEDNKEENKDAAPPVNEKNESLTRSLPSDFEDTQPKKFTKFSCDICFITVNSDLQLQQHLTSKRHQCKVEGKPVSKKKKKPVQKITNNDVTIPSDISSNEPSQKVVGVKTLDSCFIQGETLQ